MTSAPIVQNTNIQSSKQQNNRYMLMHLSNASLDEKNIATRPLLDFRNLSSFPQVCDMHCGILSDTKAKAENTLHAQEF